MRFFGRRGANRQAMCNNAGQPAQDGLRLLLPCAIRPCLAGGTRASAPGTPPAAQPSTVSSTAWGVRGPALQSGAVKPPAALTVQLLVLPLPQRCIPLPYWAYPPWQPPHCSHKGQGRAPDLPGVPDPVPDLQQPQERLPGPQDGPPGRRLAGRGLGVCAVQRGERTLDAAVLGAASALGHTPRVASQPGTRSAPAQQCAVQHAASLPAIPCSPFRTAPLTPLTPTRLVSRNWQGWMHTRLAEMPTCCAP